MNLITNFAGPIKLTFAKVTVNDARMAELVDALVSKTSFLWKCRFDPGSGYNKQLGVRTLGCFFNYI